MSVVGGSGSSSVYSNYVPKVDARNAILSDFTIEVEFEATDGDYASTITIDNVGGNTSSDLVLHFVVTESKMPIPWGLTEEQHFTNRLMVPDQNGTPLDFSGGSVQTVELDFSTESWWDVDNCELVVFVQDVTTKEIMQGTKVFMATPLFAIDAVAKTVKHPAGDFCGSSVAPIVQIKNMGSENLTSVDIEYSINGGAAQSYAWTGELGFNLAEDVQLAEIAFIPQEVNTIEVTVSNPNGQADPNPDNDYLAHEFNSAPQVTSSTVLFELKTDNYPEETSWELLNSAGTAVYSGGNYSAAGTVFTETWTLSDMDCYTFIIYDTYGDGICCAWGEGFYKIMDENSNILFEGGEFGSEEASPFEYKDEEVLTANFQANTTTIFEGESVDFTDLSSGLGITSWAWEFEGGDPATSDEQNPVVTYMVEGIYDVSLTISDGTNSNTLVKEDYIEVDHIVGIDDPSADGIHVFPNPTTGLVLVEGGLNAAVKVYNTTGTVVESIDRMTKEQIDLSSMDEGIYFIRIQTTDGVVVTRKVSLVK